jgi:UDP-glucose 4-epimerase
VPERPGRGPHIDVFGSDYPTPDDTCIRENVHVEDLAEAHLLALEALEPGRGRVFNLGSGRGHSVREVVAACEDVSGESITVRVGPRRPGDPPVLVASPEGAFHQLHWRPRYRELHAIVETAWNWHSSHPHGYRSASRTAAVLVG